MTVPLLAAQYGERRVTLGLESEEELRRLSDERALTCPGCGATVVLHAGRLRARHFAHLPGAVCRLPMPEPETEEHRAGKLLLAQWLRARLPEAEILVEAYLPATEQRADVLAALPGKTPRRLAFEFQCAHLTARDWRQRHRLYRDSGIEDLWFLGGSRLHLLSDATLEAGQCALRTAELERTLFWDHAPLLFLDAIGAQREAGTLLRFRPDAEAQAQRPTGRLSARSLWELEVPLHLLHWQEACEPDLARYAFAQQALRYPGSEAKRVALSSERWLWEWLAVRFRATPENLAPFFGLEVRGAETFDCSAQVWQAALYYRFVHRRIGDSWWLREVERWSRAYLPLVRPLRESAFRRALQDYQEALAAAGLLSMPMGYGRTNARVLADLTTLPAPPDREEALRLMRYRRTLSR